MNRRAFMQMLALAGISPSALSESSSQLSERVYGVPDPERSSISLIHFTDTHAQLNPIWYREPESRAFSTDQDQYLYSAKEFEVLAKRFGKVGGFAHLASLIARLKLSRPGALVLDGGDTWQGSALTLKTEAEDMAHAQQLLGVDVMTGHWEFTLGQARFKSLVDRLAPRMVFLAQNVLSEPFGDPVFTPWVMREQNGIPYAVIGQAYPFVPIAHPKRFSEGWTFGLQERRLQMHVDAARRQGAKAVVLLSHNGLPVDLKMAARIQGIDLILGGHTHDPTPEAIPIQNSGGTTWVSNAGSHGKFVALADLQIHAAGVNVAYRLLPVMAELLPADPSMQAWIDQVRAPHHLELSTPIAEAKQLLYRRDRFEGTLDRLILNALLAHSEADIALSPGFRWGATKLPGELITREDLMDATAVSYPDIHIETLTGTEIHARLEDIADNVFNPDPYYQEGGDMVRVGGLRFHCHPEAPMGQRIRGLERVDGAFSANHRYRVVSWAAMTEAKSQGLPVDWLQQYLKSKG